MKTTIRPRPLPVAPRTVISAHTVRVLAVATHRSDKAIKNALEGRGKPIVREHLIERVSAKLLDLPRDQRDEVARRLGVEAIPST